MAKFTTKKWKKRTLAALTLSLAASLSLGIFSACGAPATENPDDETSAAKSDTQLLKNGNFEFYTDANQEDRDKRLNLINSPNNWTLTSGSPSSDTRSGIVNTAEWGYLFRRGSKLASVADAYARWKDENVTAYDRLEFLQEFKDEIEDLSSTSPEKELFDEFSYSVDFEDVQYVADDVSTDFTLHEGVKEDEKSVLMIHNRRTSDGTLGTAQYYTSGTTITLNAGTAAKVSVWVRTDKLTHYYSAENAEDEVTVERRGGAYIGVTNTVGGTTLDQMQIININTKGAWEQYDLYVRASTFATTTFRLVLGLGQGNTDDKFYAVNGYAFFDDVRCEIISDSDYRGAVLDGNGWKEGVSGCTVGSEKDEKVFDRDTVSDKTYALDLYADEALKELDLSDANIGLTAQTSGSLEYTSATIDASLSDDRGENKNVVSVTTVEEIASTSNKYLAKIYEDDFKDKYPFDNHNLIMLMSQNGAAYTAKLAGDSMFTLKKNERVLISFFVKTSSIETGLSGAGAAVIDGENKTTISAFDSTILPSVDIDKNDEAKKDIYKGWTQCFFFVSNETEEPKTFSLEFSYGPTTIAGTTKVNYGDGYAAFANFEIRYMTKVENNYASTGDRAKKVSLTASVQETKNFDNLAATATKDIEKGPAQPASFEGVLGGSKAITEGSETPNVPSEELNIYSGLLRYEHADKYFESDAAWKAPLSPLAGGAQDGQTWWNNIFGNARQPLTILHGSDSAPAAYGYIAAKTTLAASSYRRIAMRVKVSANAKAYIYLIDTSDLKSGYCNRLSLDAPEVTYWYDDDGNICASDPTDDDFDEKTGILFTLEKNGLYKRAGSDAEEYFANLHNYATDDDGNLVTDDERIAFFAHDGKFYAYYDKDSDTYSQEVQNLPTELDGKSITRYNFTATGTPESVIVVDGSEHADEWVDVAFFLHTGNKEKNYRVEVWSGSRDGVEKNGANSYVFFDNYVSEDAASSYAGLRDEAVKDIKNALSISEKDNIEDEAIALYYTFTFYDSPSYRRYDLNEDTENEGNRYASYTQSSRTESLIYLRYDASKYYTEDEKEYMPSYLALFLDYSASEVTVSPDTPETDDNDTPSTDTGDTNNDMNIWLFISSCVLFFVLFAVIVIMIVRKLLSNRKPKQHTKTEDKRIRKPKTEAPEEKTETEAEPEPVDPDNPYNE